MKTSLGTRAFRERGSRAATGAEIVLPVDGVHSLLREILRSFDRR
jgi:hypothetical protein